MAKPKFNSKKLALPPEGTPYQLSEDSLKSSKEFGAGSSASALIRQAFAPLIFTNASTSLHIRLAETLRKIIRSGPVGLKGMRKVPNGDLSLLHGFQFNSYTQLHTVANFYAAVTISPQGQVAITLPAFDPAQAFRTAPNSNMAIVRIMAASFQFESMQYQTSTANDLIIPLDSKTFPGGSLSLELGSTENTVLMAAICMFFASGNNEHYTIAEDRKYTAGKILKAVCIENGAIKTYQPVSSPAPKPPAKEIQIGAVAWRINGSGEIGGK